MAIDTAAKRQSAIQWGLPWRNLPFPDGAIGQGDRQATALCYSGILATAASVATFTGRLEYTIPKSILHYTVPDERLEYTLPKTADFEVGEA